MILCQLTDLHMRPPGKLSNRVVDTNRCTEQAFRAVAQFDPLPEAVVITGDLTECGLEAEYQQLAALLPLLPMPVFVIPGNHDRRETLRAVLGHLPGVARDPRYVQYAIEDLPVRLVMLDTVVPGAGHGLLGPDRLDFLDRTLAAAPDRPTIVAMHHPPFVCGIGHMDAINLHDAAEFAAVIARHPQVQRIICGHHHRPITAPLAHAVASIAPSVAHQVALSLRPNAPSEFFLEPPGYQLHCLTQAGIVSHTGVFGDWPGPYPFVVNPDYPGKPPR